MEGSEVMHEHEWTGDGSEKQCASCEFVLLPNGVVATREFLEDLSGEPANFKWEEWKQYGGVR